jgi:CBS domain
LLEANRIKRVPVLRGGRLVGIVSRANLIRALAMTTSETPAASEAGDRKIRERLLAELQTQRWAEVAPANVTAKDGVVYLWSSYVSEPERQALVVAAESIRGVRRVAYADERRDPARAARRGSPRGRDHLHYGLLAEILAELARSLAAREPRVGNSGTKRAVASL